MWCTQILFWGYIVYYLPFSFRNLRFHLDSAKYTNISTSWICTQWREPMSSGVWGMFLFGFTFKHIFLFLLYIFPGTLKSYKTLSLYLPAATTRYRAFLSPLAIKNIQTVFFVVFAFIFGIVCFLLLLLIQIKHCVQHELRMLFLGLALHTRRRWYYTI